MQRSIVERRRHADITRLHCQLGDLHKFSRQRGVVGAETPLRLLESGLCLIDIGKLGDIPPIAIDRYRFGIPVLQGQAKGDGRIGASQTDVETDPHQ